MNQNTYLAEIRQFLVDLIVKTLEDRIRDEAVAVVWDDFLNDAANSVYKIDCIVDELDSTYDGYFYELAEEFFAEVVKQNDDVELIKIFAEKSFSKDMSGIDFMIRVNRNVVFAHREELVASLRKANNLQLHFAVMDSVAENEDDEAMFSQFFQKYPDLVESDKLRYDYGIPFESTPRKR